VLLGAWRGEVWCHVLLSLLSSELACLLCRSGPRLPFREPLQGILAKHGHTTREGFPPPASGHQETRRRRHGGFRFARTRLLKRAGKASPCLRGSDKHTITATMALGLCHYQVNAKARAASGLKASCLVVKHIEPTLRTWGDGPRC
jgi:hypothetical protein